MPNMKWCFDTFDGWDAYKYSDNELYQLLVQCSPDSDPQGFGYYRQIPMIRVEVLEELNLHEPKTFNELHDVLTVIKKAYPGSYPWLGEVGTNSSPLQPLLEQMLIAWSGDLFSFDNYYTVYDATAKKWSFALERPGFRELIQYLATAYKEGLLDPEFVRMRGPQWEERMLNNKGFFSYAYWNNSDNITLKGIENGNKTFKVMGFLPPIKDGKSAVIVRQVCNSTVAISAKVRDPEIFMRFVDYWLYSKDGTMLSNAGIPEVNWTWDVPEKIYKLLDPDRPNPTNETHKEKYGVRYGNMTGLRPDHLDIHGWVGNPDTDIYYQQQLIYKGHGVNPAPIVIFHDENDADIVKQIGQPLVDYVEQRLTRIITGTDDISTYDSIIQECKRIGSDRLVEILNK
jgi:putative aldouronate transport system substrate-binding protein